MTVLRRHSYSRNNIRELENVIIRAIVWTGNDLAIKPASLFFESVTERVSKSVLTATDSANFNLAYNLREQINELVQKALDKCDGVITKAAKELGITPYHLKNILDGQITAPQICTQYSQAMKNCDEIVNNPGAQQTPPPKQKEHLPLQSEKLSPRKKQVLSLVKNEGKVTNKIVQEELKVSPATAKRLLSSMDKHGFLRKRGNGRGACYIPCSKK